VRCDQHPGLEHALLNAEFQPDADRVWRWVAEGMPTRMVAKFELLADLRANFRDTTAQGPRAYAAQMLVDHPELDEITLLADAVTAVEEFHRALQGEP
jgi:hypothetical protein